MFTFVWTIILNSKRIQPPVKQLFLHSFPGSHKSYHSTWNKYSGIKMTHLRVYIYQNQFDSISVDTKGSNWYKQENKAKLTLKG
jgi:hypothetical protein